MKLKRIFIVLTSAPKERENGKNNYTFFCMFVELALSLCQRNVFMNRILKTTFGSQTENLTRAWRKMHNEEIHNLYCTTDIIRMIKSRI
jgi:peptidoglycan hydrolase-like protein with peptidoglycan-binding domain